MVTLAEEIPFAAVVVDKALDKICSYCFERVRDGQFVRVSRCLGCRVVHYCSSECQKKDRVNHKQECHLLKNCSPIIPTTICRLIARIVFKLERPDAHDASFNGRRFEDLMDHREDIEKDPERMKHFDSVLLSLREYMGKKHVPERDALMSIFGKVYTNFTVIGDQLPIFFGIGLYVGLSAQDHSCYPDAYFVFGGSKAILRSSKVKEYSKNVTVTYTDLLCTNAVRQEDLRTKYYFTCTCSVCSDPTKDFLFNSVYSACCPDSYCLLDPTATELSCFKCGKPSNITVHEAIVANQQVNIVLEQINNGPAASLQFKDPFIPDDSENPFCLTIRGFGLQKWIKMHEKFSKVLSPLNVNLLRVTNKLFDSAFKSENRLVCLKHAQNIIMAYKRYLSIGDPVLSLRLTVMAIEVASELPPTTKALELLEEAFATSVLTYDPRHPDFLIEKLEVVIDSYKTDLLLYPFSILPFF